MWIEEAPPTWAPAKKLSREALLLLAAAHVACGEADPEWAAKLSPSEVDWESLLREAGRHRVKPLLCRFLETACPDAVPHEVFAALRQFRRDNLLRNLKLTGELWTILELFAQHGIAAVPFKGPTLALMAYADLAGRQFVDLDILVDRRDVAQASSLLKTQGYQLNIDWKAAQDKAFLDVTYTLEFYKPEPGYLVELHWKLLPSYLAFGFEYEQLRQQLTPVWPGGKQMLTLAPEDLLLYLCAHGAKHCWASLGWIADVARLINQQQQWAWERMLAQARERNIERVLLLGLLLAGDLLGAALPADLKEQMRADRALVALAAQVSEELFLAHRAEPGVAAQFIFYFKLHKRLRDKLGYLLRLGLAPNVPDWEFLPLPPRLSFLYAVLRPLRLISKYAPHFGWQK